jgi:hypothetical protein
MGLSVSHGAYSGPYGVFGRFREAIAGAANIPLPIMDGFYDDALDLFNANDCRLSRAMVRCIPLQWTTLAPDPIHALLNHSDCDGYIEHASLLPLAVRLEQLADLMRKTSGRHDVRDYVPYAEAFAAGCRRAHAAGEPLLFS